jgi:hypothetical protein
MKKLLTVYLLLLSGSVFAECKVEVTAVTSDCDVFGSSCFDYYFVNDTDTTIWPVLGTRKNRAVSLFAPMPTDTIANPLKKSEWDQ